MEPLKEIAHEIKAVGNSVTKSSIVQAVDLLTDEEVDELRILISGREAEFARVGEISDIAHYKGMYLQFNDLGLVHCVQCVGGNLAYSGHSPKAEWVVHHRDKVREREEEAKRVEETRRKSDIRRQVALPILTFFLGLVSSLALPMLTKLLYG